MFKTLANSFFNKSLTVIKCLNKGVVSVCELALAQLENFFNCLAGHETGWGLIVLQVINDLLDLASVFLNRSLKVLLRASDACARALTNFEQVHFWGQHLRALSLKPSHHSEQAVHLFGCQEIFLLLGVSNALYQSLVLLQTLLNSKLSSSKLFFLVQCGNWCLPTKGFLCHVVCNYDIFHW